jgi:hypothetical protein
VFFSLSANGIAGRKPTGWRALIIVVAKNGTII